MDLFILLHGLQLLNLDTRCKLVHCLMFVISRNCCFASFNQYIDEQVINMTSLIKVINLKGQIGGFTLLVASLKFYDYFQELLLLPHLL